MDKKEFELRFQRVNSLYRDRLAHALQIMRREVKDTLKLIPVLLHYNHPSLPGFRDNGVPCGIDMFSPDEDQRAYLQSQGVSPDLKCSEYPAIYALYCMGSTSSIAQGQASDLDIWVCVSKDMQFADLNKLSEKCRFISSFAKAKGADINLFVTSENRFISGDYGQMDTEDCGSAQNLFLLDEFYRSCIKLCGRNIAWFMISSQEEQDNYSRYLSDFYESDFVKRRQWFDFGSVAKCSPVEYFGSGLWLVYKGIDHPNKAVLKILLMEAYSSEYPKTKLLSLELKDAVHKSGSYSLCKDAYYLMYRKVERYLGKMQDTERLSLARVCFYMKVKDSCDHMQQSAIRTKRMRFLHRLTRLWGMTSRRRLSLNDFSNWKLGDYSSMHQLLLSSLLQGYQALLRFCVEYGIEYAITSDDAGILSRKIYAAFDHYPGKIIINNKEHLNFKEDVITLISPSKDSVCRHGIHAYACDSKSLDLINSKPLYIAKNLVQMVSWATVNGVLMDTTRICLVGRASRTDIRKISSLSSNISSFFEDRPARVTENDLQKPRMVVKSLIVVNFERDITSRLMISKSDLGIGNSLCCGRQKMCLVGSIDVLTLNSWGELNCLSFHDGEEGLIDLAASMLRQQSVSYLSSCSELKDAYRVCSYSDFHSDYIRFDVESVIDNVLSALFYRRANGAFSIGHNTYEIKNDEDGVFSVIRRKAFSNSEDASVLSRFGMRPEFALQVPPSVSANATVGVMQYFFENSSNRWDIYIVNERNEVKIYQGFKGSRSALVNAINRYYTAQSHTGSKQNSLHFNLPQYFVVDDNGQTVRPFNISR